MITINDFKIIDGNIAINVETSSNAIITSILLWDMDNFKDYNLAIDISANLKQINNREVLIIDGAGLGLNLTKELLFMEVTSNEDPSKCNNVVGVSYDLSKFDKCTMEYLFKEYDTNNIGSCGNNSNIVGTAVLVNTLINCVENSLSMGLHSQAIDFIHKLRKLCSSSCGCSEEVIIGKTTSNCRKFKQS